MNFILIGFKNSGKSTFGRLLADRLQWKFFDIDNEIEILYYRENKTSSSVYEIYNADSRKFRALEKRAIASLEGINKSIIATGGGSVLDEVNVRCMKRIGALIYLKTDRVIVKRRMLTKKLPAFINPNSPEGSFDEMYFARESIYSKCADFIVEVDDSDNNRILDKIIQEIYDEL